MIRFPFFGYPSTYRYYSPYYRPYYQSQPPSPQSEPNQNKITLNHSRPSTTSSCESNIPTSPQQTPSKSETRKIPSKNNPISFHFEGFSDPNQVIFEVLGIKLYLDDIIILGLLFILYQEEVKDEMLFISLILLLLS